MLRTPALGSLPLCILLCFYTGFCKGQETAVKKVPGTEELKFPSGDGLEISATLYHVDNILPVIVLCHQAGYNRYEYKEIAVKLNEMGYNCLAIDQRSGGNFDGHPNETHQRAKEKNLPVSYLDAEQDITAAVRYVENRYTKNVILLGSSYSASLALKIAAENDAVMAAVAFSPGEYFGNAFVLKEKISHLNKPAFITSSRSEAGDVKALFDKAASQNAVQFIPLSDGVHGAKALWNKQPFHQEYWEALSAFLSKMQ